MERCHETRDVSVWPAHRLSRWRFRCRRRAVARAGLPVQVDHRDRTVPRREARAMWLRGSSPTRCPGPSGNPSRSRTSAAPAALLGSARVAAAAPDGYTLLAAAMGSHVAAPVLTPNVKYDPVVDFAPIGFTAHSPAVVVARKDFPAQRLERIRCCPPATGWCIETGTWRHWRVLAHDVPSVHRGDRRKAHARCLSRVRSGVE